MLKHILILLLSTAIAQTVFGQEDSTTNSHIKTCYQVQTIFTSYGARIDTMHYAEFNPAGKALITRFYRDNKVYSVATVDLDTKGQTRLMKFDNIGSLPSKTAYFYDQKGSVIKTINYNYFKTSDGSLKEMTDTSRATYDDHKNKLTTETRASRIECAYDAQNNLIRHDFYMYKKDSKFQRDVYHYQGKLLIEMVGYWYDGKLLKHQTFQYNSANQQTNSSDSTTNWLLTKQFTYDQSGKIATETQDKTSHDKKSQTVITCTYNPQGKVATRIIKSDDPMLSEVFLLKSRVTGAAKPPDDVKETYSYDQYGNRLKVTTELNDQVVKTLDFIMTYY